MTSNLIKESARGYQALNVTDLLLKNREIFLTKEVNADTCSELIQHILLLDREAPGQEIRLYINSPGGEVYSGLCLYDVIRLISSPVTTICIGDSASMGAIIFLAGEKRLMLPNSRIMIHDPSYGGGNLAGKKPLEIRKSLDSLIECQQRLSRIISERSGKPMDEILEITKNDSYFSAEEALENGFATEIVNKL